MYLDNNNNNNKIWKLRGVANLILDSKRNLAKTSLISNLQISFANLALLLSWRAGGAVYLFCIGNAELVGGFNPSEKYQSNWIISPSKGENI